MLLGAIQAATGVVILVHNMHSRKHTHMHTHTHTHTHTHIHTHIYMHTHEHTYTSIFLAKLARSCTYLASVALKINNKNLRRILV